MTRRMRIGAALAVALLLMVVAAGVALAQGEELLAGKLRAGDTVTVGADESVDGDLYLFAGTVTVDGSVDGDLTAFGGQVMVNGPVTGDVLAGGGTVVISGDVEGDVRTSGGQVTVSGSVGEDVAAAAGQFTLQGGANVGGDLIVSGGQITIGGAVAGNIEAGAGSYSRTGTVGGDEHVVQGEADEEEETVADEVGDDALDALRHFVVLLIIGAVILWLLPRLLGGAAAALRARPAASLGFGLLTFVGYIVLVIVAVILIVLLAIVFGILQLGSLVALEIVGGLLALFVVSFAFVVAVGFLADLVVGFGIARLVARDRETSWWQRFGLLAAGAAVVVIVTSLPVIGGIAKLLVVLFGLGALFLAVRGAWRDRGPRATDAPPLAAPQGPAA